MGCQPSQGLNRQTTAVEELNPDLIDSNIQTWQLIPAKTSSIFDEYHFMNFVSRSNNSYLRKVKHRKSKYERIVKVYYRSQKNEKVALCQINALKKLDHPNIVRLYEYFLDQSNIYLVFEFIDGEQLFSHLLGVDEKVRQNFPAIFRQLLTALQYCHSKGYAHLGIYPENIMIVKKNQNYLLKLIGFSQSINFVEKKKINDYKTQVKREESRLSVMYRAPETSTLATIQKTDIWMSGLILLMVITGRNFIIQFQKQNIYQVIDQWEEENSQYYKLVDLIRQMLDPNPSSRYSAKQCLLHSFLSEHSQQMYKWRMTLIYNFLHNFKEKNRLRKLFQMHILHRISSVHDQTEFMLEFNNLDKNKDGILDRDELIQGLLNSYYVKRLEAQKYVDEIFLKLDRNKNKKLQYSEFLLGTIQVGKIINEVNIKRIFQEMDVNNDGYISREQIISMFYDVSIEHEILLDKKGISLERFKAFMLDITEDKNQAKPQNKS